MRQVSGWLANTAFVFNYKSFVIKFRVVSRNCSCVLAASCIYTAYRRGHVSKRVTQCHKDCRYTNVPRVGVRISTSEKPRVTVHYFWKARVARPTAWVGLFAKRFSCSPYAWLTFREHPRMFLYRSSAYTNARYRDTFCPSVCHRPTYSIGLSKWLYMSSTFFTTKFPVYQAESALRNFDDYFLGGGY